MLPSSPPRPSSKTVLALATAAVWSLAAGGFVFWVLHMPKSDAVTVGAPLVTAQQPNDPMGAFMAKALGQAATAAVSTPAPSSTAYKLMGVIASGSGQGSALIAADGQPAKAYRVGQTVQDDWTLFSLTGRQAHLKSPTAELLLELPAPTQP
ncbi:type II secretion system protein N [Limnohabitans sp. G3-2]|uniref:type II secretion system protein N n=1 Tax=Limnohabitans sp. G3-2 TaxID=1100711 RepID=UPI000C1E6D88|nr:type II secretion system protein N [Limnohabitans sp. G3-2]PIT75808.1 hypothetical protein B9Z31_05960 [Limnohabitans sp. G3-2]